MDLPLVLEIMMTHLAKIYMVPKKQKTEFTRSVKESLVASDRDTINCKFKPKGMDLYCCSIY